jgi:dihydropteroate synthase
VLDPGLGFAKEPPHSWALLADLPRCRRSGSPLLVGASRKGFLGALLAALRRHAAAGRGARRRDRGGHVLAAQAGAWAVRVHDVRASADAVRVVAAVSR